MFGFIIDRAPGKELIPLIIAEKSFEHFFEFYKVRVDWYGYPLIHDRLITYGLFYDLTSSFIKKKRKTVSIFIDYAIKIAEEENDKRFLNAIFLVSEFCNIAKRVIKPTQEQIERIKNLYFRVKKLSFMPNITGFWDQTIRFLATAKNEFNKNDFIVEPDDYKEIVDLNFPSIDYNTPKSCPISELEVFEKVKNNVGEYEPLKFVRSAIIDSDKYWVWLYKGIGEDSDNYYVTVKQDKDNKTTISKYKMYYCISKTPEEILFQYHCGA